MHIGGFAIAMEKTKLKPAETCPDPVKKRISVLEIIGTATRGGMENYIVSFLKSLPPQQFRIACICPCESPFTSMLRQLGVEGVYITPIADNPEWRSVQMAMEVARLHEVDIFHAHMPKSHVLAGIAANLLHKPVIATVHGMHVTAHELGVALAVKSHLVTNCQETWIQALALGVPRNRVHLFHNGVDVNHFGTNQKGKSLKERLGLPPGCALVGFAGRLEYEKGPDLFIRAASVIHESLPATHFVVIGQGSMRNILKKMAGQSGLGKQVFFVEWSENMEDIYPSLDLLIHCSRNDGTSLVLLEAMSCGVAVAGLAVGGVREMIENEHTGMLAEANDWEGLAHHSILMLKQPSLLKAMGEAGRKRAVEKFNIQTNTAKIAGLLKELALNGVSKEEGNGCSVPSQEMPLKEFFNSSASGHWQQQQEPIKKSL